MPWFDSVSTRVKQESDFPLEPTSTPSLPKQNLKLLKINAEEPEVAKLRNEIIDEKNKYEFAESGLFEHWL